MTDQIVFNGINGDTGEYLTQPIDRTQTLALAQGTMPDRGVTNWLRRVWTILSQAHLGLPLDMRPEIVEEAGWAIVFHRDEDDAVKAAFAPLIEHRRRQVLDYRRRQGRLPDPGEDAADDAGIRAENDQVDNVKVLEYVGNEGENANAWLAEHDVSAGSVEPNKVPYYILLVGSPERIPFQFGQNLDVEYAVGRLHFDGVDDYSRYVRSVIDYETGDSVTSSKEAVFFSPRHEFDRATQLSADWLVKPLAEGLPASNGQPAVPAVADAWGFRTVSHWGPNATKDALRSVLAPTRDTPSPAFIFTASHGMGWLQPNHRQLADQGALVCQDWPGFGSIGNSHYYSAADVRESDARIHGLIAFLFACYGAGTPQTDRFMHKAGEEPQIIAAQPFIAALPKALLAHQAGGALACIGHVERAWGYSIQPPTVNSPQLLPFRNAIGRILLGQPVGHALKDFNERYASLSTQLADQLEKISSGRNVDEATLTTDWLERNDAQGYAVIGDPAVHLRVGDLE